MNDAPNGNSDATSSTERACFKVSTMTILPTSISSVRYALKPTNRIADTNNTIVLRQHLTLHTIIQTETQRQRQSRVQRNPTIQRDQNLTQKRPSPLTSLTTPTTPPTPLHSPSTSRLFHKLNSRSVPLHIFHSASATSSLSTKRAPFIAPHPSSKSQAQTADRAAATVDPGTLAFMRAGGAAVPAQDI